MIIALVVGALALQGCASSGAARSGMQGPVAPENPSVAIPEVDGDPVFKAKSKADFDALVASIQEQMLPGGRWQLTSKKERATINQAFDNMAKLYKQFGTVAAMDKRARAKLASYQDTVDPILLNKDGQRLVCVKLIPVGTHLPVLRCRTYAELHAKELQSKQRVQEFYRQRSQVPTIHPMGVGAPGSH